MIIPYNSLIPKSMKNLNIFVNDNAVLITKKLPNNYAFGKVAALDKYKDYIEEQCIFL